MPTTTEAVAGRRLALVVATGSYTDPALAKLRAPGRDASDLAAVLGEAAIGGFEVESVLDAPAEALRRRIAQFCAQIGPGDLALVYLSCHGVLDDRGRLYYATADTDRALLSATAVSSAWLNEQLEDCRSRRQILVLDCCHSGAFAKGAKGESNLALGERFEGRGRVVLTGSRGTEYSFEHDQVVGDSVSSVFTGALVEGLRSGDADRDGDGLVTVGELYDYAYEVVRAKEARQTPTLWTYGAEGDLLVAQSPRGAIVEPLPLPEDLALHLESARPRVREVAVAELADLLRGTDAGRALTARTELERIATEDTPSIAAAAQAALDSDPAAAGADPPPPSPPSPPSPPPPADPPTVAGPPPSNPRPSQRRRRVAVALAMLAAPAVIAIALLQPGEGEQSSAPRSAPGSISVGGSPTGIAAGEGAVWVARRNAGEVSRIDPPSEVESIPVGDAPRKIAAGEGTVWVDSNDGRVLERVAPSSNGKPVSLAECDCAVTQLAIAEGRLWDGSATSHTIVSFNPQTGEQIGVPYSPGPKRFSGVFAVGGNAVWAVGYDKSEREAWVSWIDPDLNRATKDRAVLKDAGPDLAAVAYGHGTVWIADATDGRNMVIAFDPDSEEITKEFNISNGITSDDLTVADDAVLVWDPDGGWLTTIDPEKMEIADEQQLDGFEGEDVNHEWSDLAVAEGLAWITDPAAGTVRKVRY